MYKLRKWAEKIEEKGMGYRVLGVGYNDENHGMGDPSFIVFSQDDTPPSNLKVLRRDKQAQDENMFLYKKKEGTNAFLWGTTSYSLSKEEV